MIPGLKGGLTQPRNVPVCFGVAGGFETGTLLLHVIPGLKGGLTQPRNVPVCFGVAGGFETGTLLLHVIPGLKGGLTQPRNIPVCFVGIGWQWLVGMVGICLLELEDGLVWV